MDPANDTVRIKNKLNASTRKTYGHFSWLWRLLGNSVENPVEPGKEFATKTRYNEVVKLVKNQSDRFADVERMEYACFQTLRLSKYSSIAIARSFRFAPTFLSHRCISSLVKSDPANRTRNTRLFGVLSCISLTSEIRFKGFCKIRDSSAARVVAFYVNVPRLPSSSVLIKISLAELCSEMENLKRYSRTRELFPRRGRPRINVERTNSRKQLNSLIR